MDVTRLCSRVWRSTPTGIDRIDLAYLDGALARRVDLSLDCVVTTPAFAGLLPPAFVTDVAAAIRDNWNRDSQSGEDRAFDDVRRLLERGWPLGNQGCPRVMVRQTGYRRLNGVTAPIINLLVSRQRLRRTLRTVNSDGRAMYLNTSHTQLEHGHRFQWLRGPGINPIFFIHDIIPIEYPEFCSPGSAQRHEGRRATMSRDAARVVVNSAATRTALTRYWADKGMRIPDCDVVPLGVNACFTGAPSHATPAIKAKRPYFVCVGTLEPRKNHLLLFSAWRELVASMGKDAPVLVLVGRRGWQNENIIDVLERSRQLAGHVVEVSGLGDHGLAALMRSSHGLLAPSVSEGFGLPVAEALAMQVPVIASDIEAHREVAGGWAHLVRPHDSMGWVDAIRQQTHDRHWVARQTTRDAATYRAKSSADHVEAVFEMLLASHDAAGNTGSRAPSRSATVRASA